VGESACRNASQADEARRVIKNTIRLKLIFEEVDDSEVEDVP
jgi:hypothetical protein